MSSQEQFTTFELVFHGRVPELNGFSKEFNNLHWASKHVRRLGPEGRAYFGGAPAELIILIVSFVANIITIADILAKRLARGHDSVIRIGKKEIKLEGKWTAKEIADIINVISKKTRKEEALRQVAKIKSTKIAEVKQQLVEKEQVIHDYERLVKGFADIPKKKKWQKIRAKEYQKRLIGLQKEAQYLRSFIDFLKQE